HVVALRGRRREALEGCLNRAAVGDAGVEAERPIRSREGGRNAVAGQNPHVRTRQWLARRVEDDAGDGCRTRRKEKGKREQEMNGDVREHRGLLRRAHAPGMESISPDGQVSWLADRRVVPAFPFAFPLRGFGATVALSWNGTPR